MKINNKVLKYIAVPAMKAAGLTAATLFSTTIMTPIAAAQDISAGQLSGIVVDAAGNPVANATVTAQATERSTSRTATTGSNGRFNFGTLPVGGYDLKVTSSAGDAQVSDARAVLGGSSYTITIGANDIIVTGVAARSIDFSGTATGAVFDVQETASRLPVARNLEAIALLTPQVVPGDPSFGSVALSGSSVAENIYYINGMNITNFRTFVGGSTVPFEFYDQLQVKTGGYQAEFGRSTGGALIGVTRSGSNEVRGGANIYYAPSNLRAKQPNTYVALNENDQNSSIEGNIWASGPLIKDRLYAFAFVNPRYSSAYNENRARTSRETVKSSTPFYGIKIDADVVQGHRLEFTYFNDSNTDATTLKAYEPDGTFNKTTYEYDHSGGSNYIARYTGDFTDWMTLSLMYGKSKFNRTVTGSDASVPYTVNVNQNSASQNSQFIQGIGSVLDNGRDSRDAYRADIDISANFLGTHKIRLGVDHEVLKANNTSGYSGGEINYFYRNWTGSNTVFGIAPGETYLRRIVYQQSGEFENQNTAFYIQDNWEVTDRFQLSLGVRNDRFRNLGDNGVEFVDLKNQWAPRLGATYDVTGDKRTRLSAFYGRYFLPVAANTNLRMAGQEQYYEDIYRYTGTFTDYTIVGPSLRNIVYSDTTSPDASTLVSQNLKPQYLDEFIVGAEQRIGSKWRVGVNLTHRNLKSVMEDTDLNWITMDLFCAANPATCGGEDYLDVGSGGYVLLNPGKDAIINVEAQGGFNGGLITIPAEFVGLPKAKRKYWAVELNFERAWDEKWTLSGSYTWSKTRGNYEGGVKSDNGQSDTGLTQDFDEPGWMDGSNGYLPNDRRHQFKLFGAYAVTDRLTFGANARMISGRSYGCLGIYSPGDGRANDSGNDSWYCGNRDYFGIRGADDDGPIQGIGSSLIGRGNAFRGNWEKRIDVNLQYKLPIEGLRSVTARVDVFNVFNFKRPIDYVEVGDLDSSIGVGDVVPLNPHYGKASSYQTPRYVRFGLSFDF